MSMMDLDNLKYGDVVLFYYNAGSKFVTASKTRSGYILGDLSG